MNIKHLRYTFIFTLTVLLAACNSKGYQNLNARYNGYFYADLYLTEVQQEFEDKYIYNFDEVLPIFAPIDSGTVSGNKEKLDDAFKKASEIIEWWSTSDWVDDSYLIIGEIRHLRAQFQFAIETFQYIYQNSKNDDARQKALLSLMRTYMDMGETDLTIEVTQFIDLEPLSDENYIKYKLLQAYFYQQNNDLGRVAEELKKVHKAIPDRDLRTRANYILGQLAQAEGKKQEAFTYFNMALKNNPPYEILFHAKLNQLAVAKYPTQASLEKAYESIEKMLNDSKNLEYQDIIHYTMGHLEQQRNNLPRAITNYQQATQVEQPNVRQQGLAYLRLGEIYYDLPYQKFELASRYYDSAIANLPKDFESYESIEKQQKILKNFVTQRQIIAKNDSLLALAELSDVQLDAFLDKYLRELAIKKEEETKKSMTAGRLSVGGLSSNENFADSPDGSTWYFYNFSAVNQGQLEFQRQWGNRPLEDDWRRSDKNRASLGLAPEEINEPELSPETIEASNPVDDQERAEKTTLLKNIPRSPEQKTAMRKEIQDAYYALGGIYRFDLEQLQASEQTYLTLLEKYPETHHRLETLFALYTLYEISDAAKADIYKQKIIDEFPESLTAKTLINPDYLQEKAERTRALQAEYAKAYQAYEQGDYVLADQVIRNILQTYEDVDFLPTVELLATLLKAKTESIVSYEQSLIDYIDRYPEGDNHDYAAVLLQAVRPAQQEVLGNLKDNFSEDFQQIHLVAISFTIAESQKETLQKELEAYNEANFENSRLAVGYLAFGKSREIGILFVNPFKIKAASERYRELLNEWLSKKEMNGDTNFHTFAISRDNFTLLFQKATLEDYLSFHRTFYR